MCAAGLSELVQLIECHRTQRYLPASSQIMLPLLLVKVHGIAKYVDLFQTYSNGQEGMALIEARRRQ